VLTTHALFARKVQRKLSNGAAGLTPTIILIQRDRGQFVLGDAERWPTSLQSAFGQNPELRIPALQLKGERSPCPEFGSEWANPRERSKA
jgi:hypothetical protein